MLPGYVDGVRQAGGRPFSAAEAERRPYRVRMSELKKFFCRVIMHLNFFEGT